MARAECTRAVERLEIDGNPFGDQDVFGGQLLGSAKPLRDIRFRNTAFLGKISLRFNGFNGCLQRFKAGKCFHHALINISKLNLVNSYLNFNEIIYRLS